MASSEFKIKAKTAVVIAAFLFARSIPADLATDATKLSAYLSSRCVFVASQLYQQILLSFIFLYVLFCYQLPTEIDCFAQIFLCAGIGIPILAAFLIYSILKDRIKDSVLKVQLILSFTELDTDKWISFFADIETPPPRLSFS